MSTWRTSPTRPVATRARSRAWAARTWPAPAEADKTRTRLRLPRDAGGTVAVGRVPLRSGGGINGCHEGPCKLVDPRSPLLGPDGDESLRKVLGDWKARLTKSRAEGPDERLRAT